MDQNKSWKYIEKEFKRHLIDCHDSKTAHFDLADYYEKRASFVNKIQSFGIAIVLTWLLSTQFSGFLPQDHAVVKAFPTVLALIVSVMSILEYVLKYNEQAATHIKYAQKYHALWRSCKNWKTDFPNEDCFDQARVAVQKYRDSLSEINKEAPHLSFESWGKISTVRESTEYIDPSIYNFEKMKHENDNLESA